MADNTRCLGKKRSVLQRYGFAYLLVLPAAVYIIVFQLYPIVESIRMSFTDANLLSAKWKYVGFNNYQKLFFSDKHFWPIVGNSFKWIFGALFFQLIVGMAMALILNQRLKFRFLFRGLCMVPWVMPTIVVGVMFKWMTDYYYGLVNMVLINLGLIKESVNWFGRDGLIWASVIFCSTWKGFCYVAMMVLAGLKGIPDDIYEAARVDGANAVQTFFRITLHQLAPVLFTTGLMMIISGWTKFETIWILTAGGPGYETSVLPTYVYTYSFQFYKMGMGSAVAVISLSILLIFVALYYKFANKAAD